VTSGHAGCRKEPSKPGGGRHFDQIRVGDQVKATLAQQLVVNMAKDNPPASDGETRIGGAGSQGRQARRSAGQHGAGHRQGHRD